ncbi:porin family protein [Lutibacter citreus]|uniref:outer membrane beta-barrel protein n=1 Tax=Lutibacter citreus TaxID=2138210 RepID=UPI00130027D6|nr:outer membrane beta-barrel protein [Lutibacter citreus]
MKKNILVLLLLIGTISTAQQLYIEGGKSSTSLDYKNSQGNSLENIQATSNSYITIGYRSQILTKNMHLNVGLDYSSYGAIGSDNTLGNYMEWNVNYVGLNAGLDYKLFHIKKASVYVKGALSAGFFVQGTQTFNNSVIDLKNNDDFDTILISMNAGVGFSHPISEDLSFYVQYLYGKSLDMASGDAELKITSNKIGFGLLINISKR